MGQTFCALAAAIAVIPLALTPAAGQTPAATAGRWSLPRTSDGQPDLQGIWTNATITPLERPRELAGKEFFTPDEAAEYAKQARERNNGDRRGSVRSDSWLQ
jgi:hypothetical protein